MSGALEQHLAQLDTTEEVKAGFRRFGINYGWLCMGTVILAMLATLLSTTIINVAIPEIMGTYGIGQDKAQWLSTANLAAATVGMLMTSWIVATWGIKYAVAGIMSLFTIACVVGGMSPNLEVLILARTIQGLTSGQIAPLTMSMVFILFPQSKAGMVMGVSSIGGVLAPALGPTVGGLIIDSFNWRYVFVLSIPFSGVCVLMAMLLLPGKGPDESRVPFDWVGFASLSGAITLLLLGLSNGEKEGWSSNFILGCLGSSFALWALFISSQVKNPNPLLNLTIFAHRRYAMYAITAFVFGAGLYGSTYLIPMFLQLVQGSSPTDSGLAMMPAGFAMAVAIPLCGRLADRYNPRNLIALGSVFFALSFFLMRAADGDTSFWTFAWWTVIGRIGIGLAVPSMSLGALKAVPMEIIGQASGVLNFVRQLGGAFGVNLLSVAIARRTQFHADSLYATQGSDNLLSQEWVAGISHWLSGAGLTAMEQRAMSMRYLAQSLQHQAVTLSFQDAFAISTVAFLVALVPAMMLGKVKSPAAEN